MAHTYPKLQVGLCCAALTFWTGAGGEHPAFGLTATVASTQGGGCFIFKPIINVCFDCSKEPSQTQNNQSNQPGSQSIKPKDS